MAITYDFNAIANGTALDAAGLGFTRIAQSGSTNTIVVNNGKLDFVGTSLSVLYYYETNQANHSFSVTWGGIALGGNYIPCCIRCVDAFNCIGARITSANNLEVGKYVAGTFTPFSGGTVALTRTSADVVRLYAVGNVITCEVNGVQKVQVTDSTFNTATKVGLNARTTANTGVIDAVTIDFVSVTSINGGSAIPAGKTGVAAVTAGYSGLPASITTNASGVTCSNIGGTTNAPTFDISDRVDGGLYPKDGTSVNFTFTKGSEIATGAQTVSKKATETKVVLSSPVTNNTTYFAGAVLAQTGRTLSTGDEVYLIPYSDLVMSTNSGITVTDAGTFTCWVYINAGADAGNNYFYTVTVAAGGAVVSISFAKKITTTKLTATKLTATKLTAKKA